tara:strand:+ start:144 stop:359 length:216 start_codon:yes stop_codon:yes gene_type:complete
MKPIMGKVKIQKELSAGLLLNAQEIQTNANEGLGGIRPRQLHQKSKLRRIRRHQVSPTSVLLTRQKAPRDL